jgi:DNA-binding NtrC family response regulator
VIERALVRAACEPIGFEHLRLTSDVAAERALPAELQDYERERIVQALEASGGNQTRAAALPGISRRTSINRLEVHRLPRPRKRARCDGTRVAWRRCGCM